MERRTCKLCFRSFSNGRALGGHMRSHFAPATATSDAAVKPLLSDDISISSSSGEADAAFQGQESGTEFPLPSSFPAGIHRRRSKRHRSSSSAKPDLLSSVSDVALCLMMLSRDVWKGEKGGAEEEEGQKIDGRFQCRSCKKVFRSHQALGGHRANHKKSRSCTASPSPNSNADGCGGDGKAVLHECPFCFRVFPSGQALGGHKRSHLPPSTTALVEVTLAVTSPPPSSPPAAFHGASKLCKTLFDLNLPAPPDHEDVELSPVSDHESAVSHRPVKC